MYDDNLDPNNFHPYIEGNNWVKYIGNFRRNAKVLKFYDIFSMDMELWFFIMVINIKVCLKMIWYMVKEYF